jgi:hypothetical protein
MQGVGIRWGYYLNGLDMYEISKINRRFTYKRKSKLYTDEDKGGDIPVNDCEIGG